VLWSRKKWKKKNKGLPSILGNTITCWRSFTVQVGTRRPRQHLLRSIDRAIPAVAPGLQPLMKIYLTHGYICAEPLHPIPTQWMFTRSGRSEHCLHKYVARLRPAPAAWRLLLHVPTRFFFCFFFLFSFSFIWFLVFFSFLNIFYPYFYLFFFGSVSKLYKITYVHELCFVNFVHKLCFIIFVFSSFGISYKLIGRLYRITYVHKLYRITHVQKLCFLTPIFKDKNRMHKRLMCAPGYDRTHK
jgi:hypothetical protein